MVDSKNKNIKILKEKNPVKRDNWRISDYIPINSYISKSELIGLTGIVSRDIRKKIEKERVGADGYVIVSSSKSCGYTRTKDYDLIKEMICEMNRRAYTIKATTDEIAKVFNGLNM